MEENDSQTPGKNDEFESACSSPLVSTPSSPDGGGGGGGGGFFYSAPASPVHFLLSSSSYASNPVERNGGGFEFEFTVKEEAAIVAVPADELFLNGQIRPMKLSSHLQLPQILDVDDDGGRDRDLKFRDRSRSLRRRRARSMSPTPSLRSTPFHWLEEDFQDSTTEQIKEEEQEQEEDKVKSNENENENDNETTPSGASSRSSSVGRTSKRWVQLKDFLYRSKSEGTNTGNYKFWTSLSRKSAETSAAAAPAAEIAAGKKTKKKEATTTTNVRKAVNGVGKRTGMGTRSAHELHYTANRAQAEELRRKTYLPYKQGLLGCLGFSSKSYGAMNGFARALNPVSSR